MSCDLAIRVRNLSKVYQLYDKPHDRLKQSLVPRLARLAGRSAPAYFREFRALHDISFDIRPGETVGIIGRNGSGKSTLLQIICGTLACTTGTVAVNGRIAALLELGAGFNTEFTGRENIRMSCALLGLSARETDERFDDIVAFADIGEFLEQPVKTYSSGMYVRLAFAVNIVSAPDVMIVDEALAVGDMAFQAKCMTALKRVQEGGATVLFVSHDISSVKSLCSRAIYLDRGVVKLDGRASEVAEMYLQSIRESINIDYANVVAAFGRPHLVGSRKATPSPSPDIVFKALPGFGNQFRYGTGEAQVQFAELLDEQGANIEYVEFDQTVLIRMHILCLKAATFSAAYYIHDERKLPILGAWVELADHQLIHGAQGDRFIVTYRTRLPLQDGNYSIQLELGDPVILDKLTKFIDVVNDGIIFRVAPRIPAKIWSKAFVPNDVKIYAIPPAHESGKPGSDAPQTFAAK
jgi:lipopolysaccharide transport system ATP-binding protein